MLVIVVLLVIWQILGSRWPVWMPADWPASGLFFTPTTHSARSLPLHHLHCPMHRDIKEMLIGSAGIILFGVAIIASPPFARFVDQHFFSYVRMAWDLVRHVP
jgi:hypothetical protein